jgi:DNA-binding MarR family transcriptional regulator
MDDPNLTLDERRVLVALRDHPEHTERQLGVKRAVLNNLVRRGYIRGLGGELFQLTNEGRRVVGKGDES